MSQLSQWVLTICCGVLICGMVSVLIPSKSMEKGMNLVLGLFLLSCLLLPTGLDVSQFHLERSSPEELRERVAEQTSDYLFRSVLDLGEEEAAAIIYGQAARYGIKPEEIVIYMDTEEAPQTGEKILVAEVHLPRRAKEFHSVLHKALEYELGVTVRLEYSKEEL